jgi:hypothetical protein
MGMLLLSLVCSLWMTNLSPTLPVGLMIVSQSSVIHQHLLHAKQRMKKYADGRRSEC